MNLLDAFNSFNQQVPVLDIWDIRRNEALRSLEKTGWPTRKKETWKYTNLQALKSLALKYAVQAPAIPAATQELLPGFHHIIFNDGVLKSFPQNVPGLQVVELRQALVAKSGPWTKWMGRWEADLLKLRKEKDFTEHVSEAFMDSGVCIQVDPNTKLDQPVQIAFFNSGSASANFSSTQVWIDLGAGSRSDLVLTSTGNDLQINQTQIWAHPNSKTTFLKYGELRAEKSDFQRVEVQIEANAEFDSWSVGLGGRLQRNELELFIKGSGVTANAWGVSLASGTTVLDHHTLIDHVVGGSRSEQLYKGILSDESRVVFDGAVHIRPGADKASSEQLNKNLILNGTAEVDSKPQLQVLADDVKATHGSATGQMSDEELFYFQSRGISLAESKRLLATGFVMDLIERHPVESVRKLIFSRLKTAFDRSWEQVK